MKTQVITHRARIQQEYECNQATILKAVQLTDFQYKEIIYLTGQSFIEMIYPISECIYQDIRSQVERDPMFWKFWRAEFSNWEQDLINFCRNHNSRIAHWFIEEIGQMIGDPNIEKNYQSMFLKRTKNIRLK